MIWTKLKLEYNHLNLYFRYLSTVVLIFWFYISKCLKEDTLQNQIIFRLEPNLYTFKKASQILIPILSDLPVQKWRTLLCKSQSLFVKEMPPGTGCPTKHDSSKTTGDWRVVFDIWIYLWQSVVNLIEHVRFLKQ